MSNIYSSTWILIIIDVTLFNSTYLPSG
jgi:hypothetical protein